MIGCWCLRMPDSEPKAQSSYPVCRSRQMADETQDNLRDLVAEVSAAYFANSHVGVSEIASVIEQVARSLGAIGVSSSQTAPEVEQPAAARLTAAQIRKSITP